jgi:hypothetical protein
VNYLVAGHQEGCCKAMSLCLDLLGSPNLVAMQDKVAQFVGGIKSRSSPIVLVGTQHYNRMISKRN